MTEVYKDVTQRGHDKVHAEPERRAGFSGCGECAIFILFFCESGLLRMNQRHPFFWQK
jgi:hypothetical protein